VAEWIASEIMDILDLVPPVHLTAKLIALVSALRVLVHPLNIFVGMVSPSDDDDLILTAEGEAMIAVSTVGK